MFEALGSWTYRFRYLIVAAWLVAAVLCVRFAPSIASQGTADQASFLPSSAPSSIAHDALNRAFPSSTSTSSATVTFSRDGGLTDADRAYLDGFSNWVRSGDAPADLRKAVTGVDSATSRPELKSMLQSGDGRLELVNVNLNVSSAGDAAAGIVSALRDHAARTAPSGLTVHVTGSAGITTDYLQAIKDGTSSTTIVTVILVVVMLLLIYRAPLAALVPLVTIGGAFLVARGVLGLLAAAGWQISSLLDTFVVVLVFGVGTDYTIFLISRYREELREGDWHEASKRTVRRIGAVISASAATVIVGLGSMVFGNFQMIHTMGPALAIAIAVTLVAGLTLAPALLSIFGHYLFWPLHTNTGSGVEHEGFFAKLADQVTAHPVIVAIAITIALAIPAALMPQMRTNFDTLAELPKTSDARLGYDEVAAHLGKGKLVQSTGLVDTGADGNVLSPASLAHLRDTLAQVSATSGVGSVTSLITPDGDGKVPDGFRPSIQIGKIGDSFGTTKEGSGSSGSSGSSDSSGSSGASGASGTSGTSSGSASILDPKVSSGLSDALDYVDAVGLAFPDVAARAEYRAATRSISDAQSIVDRAKAQSVVATELRTLATALTSPASVASSAGASSGSSDTALVKDYLAELSGAFPEVRGLAAFKAGTTAAASLARQPSAAAAVDAANALDALAVHFDSKPDARLEAKSLANTASAREAKRQATAAFDAIPPAMHALGSLFAGRSDDIFVPVGLGGSDAKSLQQAVDAFVSTDRTATRFYLTVSDDPYSTPAFNTVRSVQSELTAAAPGFGPRAAVLLGGPTMQLADVQTVLGADFERVGIITVLGIFVVLVLLLRALVAPLYLVATVLLSYASALGLSAWLFQNPFGQPGVSFYLPLIVFVLLVALGSDYNIFLVSRIREESETRPIRDGIRVASGRTGAVITSAGLILAGTFASMATAPLAVLFQVGVAVAIGVLIDTFIVRSILVPAITTIVGDRAWWPSGLRLVALAPAPAVPGSAVLASVQETPEVTPARRWSPRRVAVAVMLAALVPVAFAALIVWARPSTPPPLHAAVVNGDTATTITAGDGTTHPLHLGADLAATLASARPSDPVTWTVTDASSAANGLADGTYDAILTIPAGYSRAIAARQADATGSEPSPALHLETNADSTTAEISQSVAAAVNATAAGGVVRSYVADVLLAVSASHDRLTNAARTGHDIATRTATLASDASGIRVVAGELVSGLDQLAAGTAKAADGANQLAGGTKSLAGGAQQLASGAASLASGAADAAKGAAQLSTGASSLAGGLATLNTQVAPLPSQAAQLDSGAASLASGAASAATGSASLASGLVQLKSQTGDLGSQTTALAVGAAQLANGATQVAAGSAALSTSLSGQLDATSPLTLAGSVAAYTKAVEQLSLACPTMTDTVCAGLAALAAQGTALNGGVTTGVGGLAAAAHDLSTGAAGLTTGAAQLQAGTSALAASAPLLQSGIAQLAAGGESLNGGVAALSTGAATLADGVHQFAVGMPALADGVSKLSTAAAQLSDGASSLAAGVGQVATGASDVSTGADKTASGAASIAAATAASASGTRQLTTAVGQAADGSRLVQAEVGNLTGQGEALATDASKAATSLDSNAGSTASYPADTRTHLANAVAKPVSIESVAGVRGGATGFAPYLAALALWLGALAALVVVPSGRGGDPRQPWIAAIVAFLAAATLGVVGAAIMVGGLLLVGLEVADIPQFLALCALASLAFVAVVQAFVVAFGRRGWLVALLLAAVQVAASGLVWPADALPGPLAFVHPILPMSWASDALAISIGGGAAGIASQVVALAACLAVALAATIAVAGRPGPGAGSGMRRDRGPQPRGAAA